MSGWTESASMAASISLCGPVTHKQSVTLPSQTLTAVHHYKISSILLSALTADDVFAIGEFYLLTC